MWLILAALVLALRPFAAAAHEVRPALLQIQQVAQHRFTVLWKQPTVGDMAVRLVPHLSSGALERDPTNQTAAPGFLIKTWRLENAAPLDGQTISIEGLDQTVTDVLVQVRATDSAGVEAVIKPGSPRLKLNLAPPKGLRVSAYFRLGVEHILTGFDHLAVVLGLILLIGPRWRIVKAVTAFTLAHSLTLALAALGLVTISPAAIECLVALSIVFVAREALGTADTLTRRRPWLIAFIFGLLHGLAFAGALTQVGLPRDAVPASLLLFNLGVEVGQLLFIAAAVATIFALRPLRRAITLDTAVFARLAPPYAIGALAAFWFLERLLVAVRMA